MTWNFWTPERIEILKTMWSEGQSAASCADAIGCSRNAAIGKVHRLGLEKRKTLVSRPPNNHWRKTPLRIGARATLPRALIGPEQQRPSLSHGATPVLPIIPEEERVPFLDTKPGQCRFILDDEKRCCGRPTVPERSWCLDHYHVVFKRRAPVYVSKSALLAGFAA